MFKKLLSTKSSNLACKDCENGIFCLSWGHYKCTKHSRIIPDPFNTRCDQFEKAKIDPLSKDCHCEACSERGILWRKP